MVFTVYQVVREYDKEEKMTDGYRLLKALILKGIEMLCSEFLPSDKPTFKFQRLIHLKYLHLLVPSYTKTGPEGEY